MKTELFLAVGCCMTFCISMAIAMMFLAIDMVGGLNIFFAVSPIKPAFIQGLMMNIGETLKFIQFIIGNYLVIRYVHYLQDQITDIYKQYHKDIEQGIWRKYFKEFKDTPMFYVFIVLLDFFMLYNRLFHGLYRLIFIAQFSWILGEGYVHRQMMLEKKNEKDP